jgi:O-methyltransferase involved in polyketide biosynthesis
MIELKESRLAGERARCTLERVKLDLSDVPARRKFLGDIAARFKRVLVLTEGVVLYLTVDAAAQLAEDLRAQQTFAQWIVDYLSPSAVRYSQRSGVAMRNAPFLFDPEDVFAFFQSHGWGTKEVRYLWDEGQKLGRPLPLPATVTRLLWLRRLFMSHARRKEAQRFMGYMLLEPDRGRL